MPLLLPRFLQLFLSSFFLSYFFSNHFSPSCSENFVNKLRQLAFLKPLQHADTFREVDLAIPALFHPAREDLYTRQWAVGSAQTSRPHLATVLVPN